MDFSRLTSLTIPEGKVIKITRGDSVLWESGGLPSEYQEVQYISKKSDNSYIDLGFTFDTACTYYLHCYRMAQFGYFFGAAENSGKLRCMFTGGGNEVIYGTGSSNYISLNMTGVTGESELYLKVEMHKGALTATNLLTDETKTHASQIECTMTNNLYLFAQNYNGTARVSNINVRLYSFKYYDANDKLICDLVPCYRKSDEKVGVYDLVRRIFLTNVDGTYGFGRGPTVLTGTTELTDYDQVEYIKAAGNQSAYIDLGFAFDTKAKVYLSQILNDTSGTCYVFGAAETNGIVRCMLSSPYSGAATLYGYTGQDTISTTTRLQTGLNIFEMTFEKSKLQINNASNGAVSDVRTGQSEYKMDSNLYLFAQNYNGAARFGTERIIAEFKYYDKTDTLICDLIPCVRKSDGQVGMYDKVRKQFFTSVGTASFTAGGYV